MTNSFPPPPPPMGQPGGGWGQAPAEKPSSNLALAMMGGLLNWFLTNGHEYAWLFSLVLAVVLFVAHFGRALRQLSKDTRAAAAEASSLAGDTLGAIAAKYGTNVDALVRLNDFKDKNQTLNIGQKIKVP